MARLVVHDADTVMRFLLSYHAVEKALRSIVEDDQPWGRGPVALTRRGLCGAACRGRSHYFTANFQFIVATGYVPKVIPVTCMKYSV